MNNNYITYLQSQSRSPLTIKNYTKYIDMALDYIKKPESEITYDIAASSVVENEEYHHRDECSSYAYLCDDASSKKVIKVDHRFCNGYPFGLDRDHEHQKHRGIRKHDRKSHDYGKMGIYRQIGEIEPGYEVAYDGPKLAYDYAAEKVYVEFKGTHHPFHQR